MKEKQGPRIPTMYGPAIYRINESTQKNQNDNRPWPVLAGLTLLASCVKLRPLFVGAASSRDSRRGRRSYRDKRGANG